MKARVCPKCGIKKPLTTEYYHRMTTKGTTGFQTYCKKCRSRKTMSDYLICADCGKAVKRNSSQQKYCRECSDIRDKKCKKQYANRMRLEQPNLWRKYNNPIRNKEYYWKNRELLLKKGRERKLKNPHKKRLSDKLSYRKHIESRRLRGREYYQRTRAERLLHNHRAYINRRDSETPQQREYRLLKDKIRRSMYRDKYLEYGRKHAIESRALITDAYIRNLLRSDKQITPMKNHEITDKLIELKREWLEIFRTNNKFTKLINKLNY